MKNPSYTRLILPQYNMAVQHFKYACFFNKDNTQRIFKTPTLIERVSHLTIAACLAIPIIGSVVYLALKTFSSISLDEAFFQAIENNDRDSIHLYLEIGSDPNMQDRQGKSPLRRAVELDHDHLVDLLIHYGADVNVVYLEEPLTHFLAKTRRFDMLKKFISNYGVDVTCNYTRLINEIRSVSTEPASQSLLETIFFAEIGSDQTKPFTTFFSFIQEGILDASLINHPNDMMEILFIEICKNLPCLEAPRSVDVVAAEPLNSEDSRRNFFDLCEGLKMLVDRGVDFDLSKEYYSGSSFIPFSEENDGPPQTVLEIIISRLAFFSKGQTDLDQGNLQCESCVPFRKNQYTNEDLKQLAINLNVEALENFAVCFIELGANLNEAPSFQLLLENFCEIDFANHFQPSTRRMENRKQLVSKLWKYGQQDVLQNNQALINTYIQSQTHQASCRHFNLFVGALKAGLKPCLFDSEVGYDHHKMIQLLIQNHDNGSEELKELLIKMSLNGWDVVGYFVSTRMFADMQHKDTSFSKATSAVQSMVLPSSYVKQVFMGQSTCKLYQTWKQLPFNGNLFFDLLKKGLSPPIEKWSGLPDMSWIKNSLDTRDILFTILKQDLTDTEKSLLFQNMDKNGWNVLPALIDCNFCKYFSQILDTIAVPGLTYAKKSALITWLTTQEKLPFSDIQGVLGDEFLQKFLINFLKNGGKPISLSTVLITFFENGGLKMKNFEKAVRFLERRVIEQVMKQPDRQKIAKAMKKAGWDFQEFSLNMGELTRDQLTHSPLETHRFMLELGVDIKTFLPNYPEIKQRMPGRYGSEPCSDHVFEYPAWKEQLLFSNLSLNAHQFLKRHFNASTLAFRKYSSSQRGLDAFAAAIMRKVKEYNDACPHFRQIETFEPEPEPEIDAVEIDNHNQEINPFEIIFFLGARGEVYDFIKSNTFEDVLKYVATFIEKYPLVDLTSFLSECYTIPKSHYENGIRSVVAQEGDVFDKIPQKSMDIVTHFVNRINFSNPEEPNHISGLCLQEDFKTYTAEDIKEAICTVIQRIESISNNVGFGNMGVSEMGEFYRSYKKIMEKIAHLLTVKWEDNGTITAEFDDPLSREPLHQIKARILVEFAINAGGHCNVRWPQAFNQALCELAQLHKTPQTILEQIRSIFNNERERCAKDIGLTLRPNDDETAATFLHICRHLHDYGMPQSSLRPSFGSFSGQSYRSTIIKNFEERYKPQTMLDAVLTELEGSSGTEFRALFDQYFLEKVAPGAKFKCRSGLTLEDLRKEGKDTRYSGPLSYEDVNELLTRYDAYYTREKPQNDALGVAINKLKADARLSSVLEIWQLPLNLSGVDPNTQKDAILQQLIKKYKNHFKLVNRCYTSTISEQQKRELKVAFDDMLNELKETNSIPLTKKEEYFHLIQGLKTDLLKITNREDLMAYIMPEHRVDFQEFDRLNGVIQVQENKIEEYDNQCLTDLGDNAQKYQDSLDDLVSYQPDSPEYVQALQFIETTREEFGYGPAFEALNTTLKSFKTKKERLLQCYYEQISSKKDPYATGMLFFLQIESPILRSIATYEDKVKHHVPSISIELLSLQPDLIQVNCLGNRQQSLRDYLNSAAICKLNGALEISFSDELSKIKGYSEHLLDLPSDSNEVKTLIANWYIDFSKSEKSLVPRTIDHYINKFHAYQWQSVVIPAVEKEAAEAVRKTMRMMCLLLLMEYEKELEPQPNGPHVTHDHDMPFLADIDPPSEEPLRGNQTSNTPLVQIKPSSMENMDWDWKSIIAIAATLILGLYITYRYVLRSNIINIMNSWKNLVKTDSFQPLEIDLGSTSFLSK